MEKPTLIGDLRTQLTADLKKELERIVNAKKHLDRPYYILVYAKAEYNTIVTKIITMFEKPQRMLGTACFKVNNKQGEIWREWILPLDGPQQVLSAEGSQAVVSDILGDALGKAPSLDLGGEGLEIAPATQMPIYH